MLGAAVPQSVNLALDRLSVEEIKRALALGLAAEKLLTHAQAAQLAGVGTSLFEQYFENVMSPEPAWSDHTDFVTAPALQGRNF